MYYFLYFQQIFYLHNLKYNYDEKQILFNYEIIIGSSDPFSIY